MKIRFSANQWRNFLFIHMFFKYRYNTELTPETYISMYSEMHKAYL